MSRAVITNNAPDILGRGLINPCRILLLLCAAFATGCTVVSVDKKTRYSDAEGHFDSNLLTQIEPEETTTSWLKAHFGEPLFVDDDFRDRDTSVATPVQINTWRFVRTRQKSTKVFLLFRSRNVQEANEYLHVVTAGDQVVKAWRDELETVDTKRVMGALGYAASAQPSRLQTAVMTTPLPTPAHTSADAEIEVLQPVPPSALVPQAPPVVVEDIKAEETGADLSEAGPEVGVPNDPFEPASVAVPVATEKGAMRKETAQDESMEASAAVAAKAAAARADVEKNKMESLGPASADYPL